jgi:hypothetical protein
MQIWSNTPFDINIIMSELVSIYSFQK